MRFYAVLILIILNFYFSNLAVSSSHTIKIGSKKFTENVILAELGTQLIREVYPNVEHLQELGGTRVLWNALLRGEIDIYPEYSGTIIQEILANRKIKDSQIMSKILAEYRISVTKPLGFNNTYALGMKKTTAAELKINNISDLIQFPKLKFGFTNEFMDRGDGWPSLRNFYQLPQKDVKGLDHDLAYRGLESRAIDLIDLYSTDAEIKYYNLKILNDDRHFFTNYQAVYLYRSELVDRLPASIEALSRLEGQIPESQIIQLNAQVKLHGQSEKQAAADFIRKKFDIRSEFKKTSLLTRLGRTTTEHLFLVLISLISAIIISIPLGILSFRYQKMGQFILGIVGIIQTIPSLALIVFMIPLLGIGAEPAIVALFLYSLLPIVRNTYSGLNEISRPIIESAEALGLTPFTKLRLIELPLASRSILAGIKTSAVINIGTATLGALIGAGGYGQPILTGIRLDNIGLILEGAIPAALLALITQGFFEFSERYFVPKGLRIKSEM